MDEKIKDRVKLSDKIMDALNGNSRGDSLDALGVTILFLINGSAEIKPDRADEIVDNFCKALKHSHRKLKEQRDVLDVLNRMYKNEGQKSE